MPTNYNKRKIINDPVYGFIHLPFNLLYDLIEHPYFQRLRRVKQLGLSHLVYPGALHTRFHHALGAMHLMTEALEVIRYKGHEVSQEEYEGAVVAILLHDIGHGPFSHTLEHTLLNNVSHEEVSLLFMEKLNKEFDGQLNVAIDIFTGKYPKPFLHQLVSSQLDMDRLDYLKRDSFYTGVSEGVVSSKRIIKMLNVHNNELVLEEKGIYSIEKFIVARRLMYWQVYLHKTAVAAEHMLVQILKRAKALVALGELSYIPLSLKLFLTKEVTLNDFHQDESVLQQFSQLDDNDITYAIKNWQWETDKVLSFLCQSLLNRKLFKAHIQKTRLEPSIKEAAKAKIASYFEISEADAEYLFVEETLQNQAYKRKSDNIKLLTKEGEPQDIESIADNLNLPVLTEPVRKYFVSFPKEMQNCKDWPEFKRV